MKAPPWGGSSHSKGNVVVLSGKISFATAPAKVVKLCYFMLSLLSVALFNVNLFIKSVKNLFTDVFSIITSWVIKILINTICEEI